MDKRESDRRDSDRRDDIPPEAAPHLGLFIPEERREAERRERERRDRAQPGQE